MTAKGGSITNRRNVIGNNFTFGANSSETGQIARFVGTNTMDFQLGDAATDLLTLNGRSTFQVDAAGQDVFVLAKTTGTGTLVKSRLGVLSLENTTNINDWSGGTIVWDGTLSVRALGGNVAAGASSQISAGGLGTGDITLMGGTLQITSSQTGTVDTNAERFRMGASGNGNNIIVGGSSVIDVRQYVGGVDNKLISFNNLQIGSHILTVTGANGHDLEFAGTTTLIGTPHLNPITEMVLNNITDGGAGLGIVKNGSGNLWINATHNTPGQFAAGLTVNSGLLAFGWPGAGNATASFGAGRITINPVAEIQVRGLGNINTALGQNILIRSTSYGASGFRAVVGFTQAEYQSMIQSTTPQWNENSYIAFEGGTLNQNLDQSTIGNGRMFFGNVGDRILNGAATDGTLTPGLANLPDSVVGGTSTNRIYRLGARVTANTLTVDLAGAGNLTDVGGATDVQIGSLANLGPNANWGLGQVLFADQNTYTGATNIVRGSILRFNTGTNVGDTAGGLGAPGASPINVYGNPPGGGSQRHVPQQWRHCQRVLRYQLEAKFQPRFP